MPHPRLKPLAEQVVVVTGATSGIGLTTACEAAAQGASLVLAARNEEALREVRDGIRRGGGRAEYVVADVGDREEVARIVACAREAFGGFDTWVNNAGIGVYATLDEMSDEDHERIFRTNYWGVVYGSREAVRHLRHRPGGGALINIGSISSEMPSPLLGAYTATKHAVKGYTDSLRLEMINEDAPIAVTLIQPSGIDTPFGEHAKNEMDEASQVPPPAYAPEAVAEAILHAAQHPTRNLIVGGTGRAQIAAFRLVPALADRAVAWLFNKTARIEGQPPRDTPANLHRPGEDGKRHGDQGHQFSRSWYTRARMHPGQAAAVALVAAGVAGLAVAATREG